MEDEKEEPEQVPRKRYRDIERQRKAFPELFQSDSSMYPSYSKLTLPYFVVARVRYNKNRQLIIRNQFVRELKILEMHQSSALRGVRVHRCLMYGMQSPTPRIMPDLLKPNERWRVEDLLKSKLVRN